MTMTNYTTRMGFAGKLLAAGGLLAALALGCAEGQKDSRPPINYRPCYNAAPYTADLYEHNGKKILIVKDRCSTPNRYLLIQDKEGHFLSLQAIEDRTNENIRMGAQKQRDEAAERVKKLEDEVTSFILPTPAEKGD